MRALLLLLALMLPALALAVASGDGADEAWIARYVGSGQAPGVPARRPSADLRGFDQLAAWLGRQVRVVLHDGREQSGVVESVDPAGVRLRTRTGDGVVRFAVARDDLRGFRSE